MVYNVKLEGSPREIGEKIAQIVGDRRVAVLLMDDATALESLPVEKRMTDGEIEAFLSEIETLAVEAPHVDDSREAMYTRLEDE